MFGEPGPSRRVFGRPESPINPSVAPDQTRVVCGLHVTYSCVVTLFFFQVINKNGYICKKEKEDSFYFIFGWNRVEINQHFKHQKTSFRRLVQSQPHIW